MIRVILVDDHPVVRAGMRAVLEKAGDVLVAAEGGSGAEALRMGREYRPDVLILDINLPDMTGLAVARQLQKDGLKLNLLILTLHADAETVFEALDAGAMGYVLKDEALETLPRAVRAVAEGESWLSPAVASKVVRRAVDGRVTGLAEPELPVDLTDRELDVLKLLAQGLDNAAIAEELVLTKRTIQNHVSNIYGKLGTSSRTEAMLFAIQNGLVEIPSGGKDSHAG